LSLILRNISKKVYFSGKEINILNSINLEIQYEKITVLSGDSGSGKSTLLNIMALIDTPSSGEYIIDGKTVNNLNSSESADLRAKYLGVVFQNFNLLPKMSSYDNVKLPLYLNKDVDSKERHDIVIDKIEMVGMINRTNHFPNTLSCGEQQRIAIARSIVNNPRVVFADEPTGNLDKTNEEIILNYFKKIANNGKAIFIVTHSERLKNVADRVYTLKGGEVWE